MTASIPAADNGSAAAGPQSYFDDLIAHACTGLTGQEVLTASLSGEDSDFIRFNKGDVRQAGSVHQAELAVELISGDRHALSRLQLAQDVDIDKARLDRVVVELREQLSSVPADPYLSYATEVHSTERIEGTVTPDPGSAIADIRTAAAHRDLVGIYAAGDMFRGFANSLGQRNWYQSTTFNFDWSFYLHADRAVKNLYAGQEWDEDTFSSKIASSTRQLEALGRTAVDLAPGGYRTFLAPAAMIDLVGMMSRGGFGLKAHRTKQTPLLRMVTEDAGLAPGVDIVEDTVGGYAPDFQAQGFLKPDRVTLIEGGVYKDHLVSPRSAAEYEVPTNGASRWEAPEALSMAGGGLAAEDAVARLGTGLYVGNLWYLNFSDRAACRTTGMTRFATFWVEGGEIVAPANVLRFDDTAYRMLGDNLIDLTTEVETFLDSSTYGGRSSASHRLPGALVEDMAFTL